MGALLFHAYGAYVVMLRQEFGWSKTMFSAAFAMARAESGILGPIQGWLTDRFGPRTLIRIGHGRLRRRLHAVQPDRLAADLLPHVLPDRAGLEPRRLSADRRRDRRLVPPPPRARPEPQLDRHAHRRTPDAGRGAGADHVRLAVDRVSVGRAGSRRSACRCSHLVRHRPEPRGNGRTASSRRLRPRALRPIGGARRGPRGVDFTPREAMRTPAPSGTSRSATARRCSWSRPCPST